jgi:hypothetical protein
LPDGKKRQHVLHGGSVPFELAAEIARRIVIAIPTPLCRHSEREQHWISELTAFDTFPVLFVLGACHVESFCSLLGRREFQGFIIERNWQPDKPD